MHGPHSVSMARLALDFFGRGTEAILTELHKTAKLFRLSQQKHHRHFTDIPPNSNFLILTHENDLVAHKQR